MTLKLVVLLTLTKPLYGGHNLFEYCHNNPVNYTGSDGITHMYNCWNNVTNKKDSVYESVGPPGYQFRAEQVRFRFGAC